MATIVLTPNSTGLEAVIDSVNYGTIPTGTSINIDSTTQVSMRVGSQVFRFKTSDNITIDGDLFSGNATQLKAAIEAAMPAVGGGGGLSQAEVDARVHAVLSAGVDEIKLNKPTSGTVTLEATDDVENPLNTTA
jgi:hypothetical protein